MDFNKLKIFVTVAKLGSFTAASERLFLTQPAVSRQVKALEEYFNISLFIRNCNNVILTPAGRQLFIYATKILSLAEDARTSLEEILDKPSGCLNLGASYTVATYILPEILTSFKEEYPNCKVSVSIFNSKKVLEQLLEGMVELGLTGVNPSQSNIVCQPFWTERIKLITAPNHPWVKEPPTSPQALTEQLFILWENGSGLRKTVDICLANDGIQLDKMMELSCNESIIRMVEANLGVSLLNEMTISRDIELGLLKSLNLPFLDIKHNFYLVYRKEHRYSVILKIFISHLLSQCKSRI